MIPPGVFSFRHAVQNLTFDRFVIQSSARQVLVDGRVAKLGARAFDVLMALVERRDTVVSKNELLDIVWPGLVVEENNLQVHVSTLRKLLGPQTILTIPGQGYRFSASMSDAPAKAALPSGPDVVRTETAAISARALPGNLPSQMSPLFGRESELAILATLLPSQRLITITGAGGMGKTRLAQMAAYVASQNCAAFPDGAWLTEFAPVNEWRLVLATLASTLGIVLDEDAVADSLAARLAGRKMLIVLDNCEHVAAHVAELANALLRAAPHIHLLATSQESLRLTDEHVMRLGALTFPPMFPGNEPIHVSNSKSDVQHNTNYGAVRLFAARAKEAAPQFVLSGDNASAVVEICRRLDGIPLAIELAAARLPLLGLEGLRRRLDDRFRLLVSGSRLAPQRQQTLLAALEWSHALLAPDEQIVFRRLGVFTGSFGLDAVQIVGSDGDFDEWGVLDLLAALIDKSLVVSEPGDVPRYRLLESARAFALERLTAAGEQNTTLQRLAQALLQQHEKAFAGRWTLTTGELLATTLPDVDNLRAAITWAASDNGDATLLAALVGASGWFWKPANLTSEGLRWFQEAMQRLPSNTPADVEARLLLGYAVVSQQASADAELAALHRAAALYGSISDNAGLYESLCVLAQKQIWRHDLIAAKATIARASDLYDTTWPPVMREGLLIARTYWLEVSGRPAEGEPLMAELVRLMRPLGDDRKLDHALMQLAESLFIQGKAIDAIAVRREVVQRIGSRRVNYAASNLSNLCAALTYNNELDEALQTARAAFPLLLHEDSLVIFADHVALLACKLNQHAESARLLGRSDANFMASGFDREQSELRAARMTLEALRSCLPEGQLEELMTEGLAMTTEALVRAVLDMDRRSAARAA